MSAADDRDEMRPGTGMSVQATRDHLETLRRRAPANRRPIERCGAPLNGGRHPCQYRAGHAGPCHPHTNTARGGAA